MEPALVRKAKRRASSMPLSLWPAPTTGLLPTDILHEVLLRLPANVLCRLRLVCRQWRSLTSDPIFARAHLLRHPVIVGCRNFGANVDRDARRGVQFVDLSGNIIKRIRMRRYHWDYGHNLSVKPSLQSALTTKSGCLLNPSTGAFIVLPGYTAEGQPIMSLSLLGRISSTGEYKVLRIHRFHRYIMGSEPGQTCEVMTVGDSGDDGRWMARASPPVNVAVTSLHGVVVNGVAYFLLDVCDPTNIKWDDIASFNLDTEEWRSDTLRGPPKGLLPIADEETRICLHLAKLNGCLVTICRCNSRGLHYKDDSMDLWFSMDMNKGLWTKMYSLQCTPELEHGLCSPLEVLNDERILLWQSSIQCLGVYDKKTNILTDLMTLRNFSGVCLYEGSLLCPNLQD
ncbi:unnamed protein product [Urochloa decumbens]|uniref:F-box domain-containing protein n=1 Tax=Urochloa decumbens TaxID=240449 RepID=A0ABC9FNV9_9POAL